jgi:hypothetical protein
VNRRWVQSVWLTIALVVLACTSALMGCGGGGGGGNDAPPTGTLRVTVVDGLSSSSVKDATVLLVEGATGSPLANTLVTDKNGTASAVLPTVAVLVRVFAQGYSPVPPASVDPLPVQVRKDQTSEVRVEVFGLASPETLGWAKGSVRTAAGQAVPGALVVADVAGAFRSTTTGSDGAFILHNVPAGSASITAWKTGLNFPGVDGVQVVAGQETSGVMLTASSTPTNVVTGNVSFLAVENGVTDITITHPGTHEVVPGLRTFNTTGNQFSLSGVPNGTFDIIASLDNDGFVLDPDRIVKFGTPSITVAGLPVTVDFDVTDSVALLSPVDNEEVPVPAADADLVFSWAAYPSTSDYVVEVVNESGEVIWGGFAADGTKKVTTTATSIGFNDDGTATEPLEVGRYYQVRVYASKDDQKQVSGYTLISSTEALRGVFRVIANP